MHPLIDRLRPAPPRFDSLGRPAYPTSQEKGLLEGQNDQLLQRALADGYIGSVARDLFGIVRNEAGAMRELLDRPLDIVEIGGGAGHLFDLIQEHVDSFINVDPGQPQQEPTLQQRLRDERFLAVAASGVEIPLPDESADLVVAIASMDHVPDHKRCIREISRILRPEGRFLMTMNNRSSWWKRALARTKAVEERQIMAQRDHYTLWNPSEARAALEEQLQVEKVVTTTFIPYVPKAWKVLLPLANRLGRGLGSMSGGNMILVATPRGAPRP